MAWAFGASLAMGDLERSIEADAESALEVGRKCHYYALRPTRLQRRHHIVMRILITVDTDNLQCRV